MATDMAVANEIYRQLGGRRFAVMTGAKNLGGGVNYLSFTLPSTAHFVRDKINSVQTELNDSDLYDITYGRIWGTKYQVIKKSSDIWVSMLQAEFTAATGLDVRL